MNVAARAASWPMLCGGLIAWAGTGDWFWAVAGVLAAFTSYAVAIEIERK